ncbi:MAG: chromosome partition protein MukE [Myxococcales bacterium]|nr:chromosome partition protein MukE [Myxococcales bacterium]
MSSLDPPFADLAAVIAEDAFPRLDQALRSGRHVDRRSPADYQFLEDAAVFLEPHYRRYGADLVQTSDGYFYLRPVGERLPARRLTPAEMLVGQTLALYHLEPATLETGTVSLGQLLERLRDLLGNEVLVTALNHRRKATAAQHLAERKARADVVRALRRLAALGFVDLLENDQIGLRDALMRFVEPVRTAPDLSEALQALVRRGDVALPDEGELDDDEVDEDEDEA